jgi:hypothetical protein
MLKSISVSDSSVNTKLFQIGQHLDIQVYRMLFVGAEGAVESSLKGDDAKRAYRQYIYYRLSKDDIVFDDMHDMYAVLNSTICDFYMWVEKELTGATYSLYIEVSYNNKEIVDV